MRARIEREIQRVPAADTTGVLRLDLTTVAALAVKTVDLSASWKDFVAAAKEMGGMRSAAADTSAGNTEAWSIMHPTYLAVLSETVLGNDPDLYTINQRHTTTAGSAQLSPAELAQWTARACLVYHEHAYSFRGGGGAKPSLQAAIQQCEQGYHFTAMKYALHWAQELRDRKRGRGRGRDRERDCDRDRDRGKGGKGSEPKEKGPKGKGDKPAAAKEKAAEGQSRTAWTERTAVIAQAAFEALRKAARTKYWYRTSARNSSLASAATVASCTRARVISPISSQRTASPSRATRWPRSVNQRPSNIIPCTLQAHARPRTLEPAARAAHVLTRGAT